MLSKIYKKSKSLLGAYKNDQRGVTAIEYAMIGVAMAVVIGIAFAPDGTLGNSIQGAMNTISNEITSISNTTPPGN